MRTGILFIAAMLLWLTACRQQPPAHPDYAEIQWRTHTSATLGFSLEVPDFYTIQEDEFASDVIFRMDGYPVLMISLLDRDQADGRGLWADHEPAGRGALGGRPAMRYEYDHRDGPFVMRTLSWVTEWRGRYLEFALRTEARRPDPVQQRMLDSFTPGNLN